MNTLSLDVCFLHLKMGVDGMLNFIGWVLLGMWVFFTHSRDYVVGFFMGALLVTLNFLWELHAAKRKQPKLQSGSLQAAHNHRLSDVYMALVRSCNEMTAVADRLIAYEMTLDRSLTPLEATRAAYDRLCRDRDAK